MKLKDIHAIIEYSVSMIYASEFIFKKRLYDISFQFHARLKELNKLEQTEKLDSNVDLYMYRFNKKNNFFLLIEIDSIIIIAFWSP